MLSQTEKSLRGRVGAHRLHSLYDSRDLTAKARAAGRKSLDARLLAEIDPENTLPEAERERRLWHARKAHFSALALKSATSRRRSSKRWHAGQNGGDGDGS